ncbi:hypothetical protein Tco_0952296 [Tanacetum coccineum]|uniref:Uncharacterized protein n=1 Tax=Tanacetum coccineum TaxID=301880 RepID=A0ABQ5DWK2_9ASTR
MATRLRKAQGRSKKKSWEAQGFRRDKLAEIPAKNFCKHHHHPCEEHQMKTQGCVSDTDPSPQLQPIRKLEVNCSENTHMPDPAFESLSDGAGLHTSSLFVPTWESQRKSMTTRRVSHALRHLSSLKTHTSLKEDLEKTRSPSLFVHRTLPLFRTFYQHFNCERHRKLRQGEQAHVLESCIAQAERDSLMATMPNSLFSRARSSKTSFLPSQRCTQGWLLRCCIAPKLLEPRRVAVRKIKSLSQILKSKTGPPLQDPIMLPRSKAPPSKKT